METDHHSSDEVLYIIHARPLPCRYCGTLTVISAFEARDDRTWLVSPLYSEHRPAAVDEGTKTLR